MPTTLSAHGSFDLRALQRELEALLGPLQPDERWELVYDYEAGRGLTARVTLHDASFDAAAVQAILDQHVSEPAVAARARALEAWESATQPECPKCGGHRWQRGPRHDGERTVQFAVFAAVLLAVAAAMHAAGVFGALLPALLSAFVLWQAALKWMSYAGRRCEGCQYSANDWFGRAPDRPD